MRSRQEKEEIAARIRRNARIMGVQGACILLAILFLGAFQKTEKIVR